MNNYPTYPYYSKETKSEEKPLTFPPQHQDQQPGLEYLMNPKPIFENPSYKGSNKNTCFTAGILVVLISEKFSYNGLEILG